MSERTAIAAAPTKAAPTRAHATRSAPASLLAEPVAEPIADHVAEDAGSLRAPPHDFAGLDTGSVLDANSARRLVTQRLLEQLAPALGLDPRRVRIEVRPSAEARLSAAGARGLQEGATILLHPKQYEPSTEEGRYLLAHEAAHVAQRELSGPSDAPAAEAEAAELAETFAKGTLPHRPLVPIGLRAAADAGAGQAIRPALDSDMVKVSRSREIAVIRSALSGLWVSDGDVFDVMRILDSVPYAAIKPILFCLREQERYWLADNINPPHVYKHRRSVLACYCETLSDARLRDAVDLKVFRALPVAGMSTEEIEAAAWVLRHLSDGQRNQLLRSSNGPAIDRIINAPRPSQSELDRIAREADEAAKDESALFEKRKAILAHSKDAGANSLIDRIKSLLSAGATGGRDTRPTPYTARAALDLLSEGNPDDPRFLYIAEQLEEAGLVDVLLEYLPPGSFFDTQQHSATLIALVQSRLPYKNEKLIEDLLSYGLLDWAIRDYEALFAYKLIRCLPPLDQYRFRLRDGGKWYLRLLDNLPSDPVTKKAYPGIEIRKAESRDQIEELRRQGASEVDEKNLLYNASQVYEKKLQDSGATRTLQELIDAFKQAKKGIFRDAEAKDLYRRLRLLGGSSLEPGKEHPGDQILREAVIHELDTQGYIEELFEQLPTSFLFAEENRVATVKIMLARDPTRAQAHARDLVTRGFTNLMISDGEAYLAYQCVKALPQDERDAFIEQNGKLWSRIQSEMSESMRQSRDLNLYIGDQVGVDRASVLGQLAEAATWTDENASLVGDLVRMSIAMTEHRFAFERSKEFKAVEQRALAPLVEKFRLWDPVKRPVYKPDLLKGTHWYEEGIFADLRTLWSGLVTLWNLDVLFVDGKVGAKVDLGDVQDFMGGDLMGARLASPKKRGAQEKPPHPDANKVTLLLGTDGRSAELILPELKLESANIQLGASTLQSGAVTLGGLHIQAAYDSDGMNQPTQASAKIDSLVANDLLLAKSRSMITVTRLVVSALRLAAGTVDTISPGAGRKGKGLSVPFPLLVVPLLALFVLLALPVYLYRKIAGLFSQGLESNTGEHFAADVAQRTKAVSFTLGSLDVDSITTSGGQHVGHAAVRDFAVRVGLNKATRLRAEQRSLSQRIGALQGKAEAAEALNALSTRKSQVDRDLVALDRDELEYLAIMKQIRKGGLSRERQKTLQDRLNALNFEDKGGAFIDVGSIEVSGVRGNVTSKDPIRLSGIHGEGGGSALTQLIALPTATDAELSRRSAAGERPDRAFAPGQDGEFRLDIGDVHTGRIAIGGGLRTVADIDRQIAELKPSRTLWHVAPLYESLQTLREKAARYELFVQHGVSQLDTAQLAEFRKLRQDLAAQADLIVESIDILHATLDVDVATGRVGFAADSVRVAGIDAPGNGIHIDELIARGLGVRALPKGGLLGWADWKKNVQDAEGHVDSLEISGARSKYHGLLFEKATLTGAYAGMKDRGNALEAGLKQFSVEKVGVAPRIGLLQQQLDGLRQKERFASDKDKAKLAPEIRRIEDTITGLQQLVEARMAAYVQLEGAKDPKAIDAAKEAVAHADSQIAIGLAQFGATRVVLDEFGVKASGAGDVLSDALAGGVDPMALLRRGGIRVEGTGENHRLFKRFAVTGVQGSSSTENQGPSVSAEAADFEIGETRLDVSARQEGDSIHVDVPEFSIGSLSIRQFLLTSTDGEGGLQLWSEGASGFEGIRFKGRLRLDARTKDARELADFRLAHVHIDAFRIDRVFGNRLGFKSIGEKLEVSIKSGAIGGIHAEEMDIAVPSDPKAAPVITGKAGIDSIDDLVIGNAVSDAWNVSRGRINARKIEAAFLEDGGLKASVGSLSLTGFAVRGPDGWVRFSLADAGLKLGYRNGVLDVEDVHFASLRVDGIHWKVGEKGFVEANQPTTISDVRLKGRIETKLEPSKAAPGKPGEKERQLSRLTIERLHIGKVESDHLLYQDEDNRIELRPADWRMESHMVGFRPLFLQNLDVWGLDWTPTAGIGGGQVTLGEYEGAAHYAAMKTKLRAGFALSGKGMSAQMVGPGAFTVDVGKIEKTGGELSTDKFGTGFATGNIVGKVAVGPDYVEAHDVEIGRALLTGMRFEDLPKVLKLGSANVGRIKLGSIRQNYAISTDPATRGEKTPTTLEVRGLELFEVIARTLDYKGESRGTVGSGAAAKTEVSTQHIRGSIATISHLQVSKFDQDTPAGTRSISAKIDTAPGAKSGTNPFAIQGLSAELIDTLGSETTKKSLFTDVTGGPLTATDIKFKDVVLGTAPGPDGKPIDVKRTSIDGSFELTALGFQNPGLTLTDAKGKTTSIGGSGSTVDIAGIKPRFLPNGAVLLPVDSVIAKGMTIQRGDMTVALPLLEIKNIAVGLSGMGTAAGMEMLATKLGEIHFEGAKISIVKARRQGKLSDDEYAAALKEFEEDQAAEKKDPSGKLIVEPLSGLHGDVEGELSVDNWFDPDIMVKIRGGKLDVDDLTHYGVWLQTENVTRNGVTRPEDKLVLGAFAIDMYEFERKMPGFRGGSWIRGDAGSINFRELVEGLANEPATEPAREFKPAEGLDKLYGFSGMLSLGDGRIGRDKTGDDKLGEGDTWVELKRDRITQNNIKVSAAKIGQELSLGIHELHMSGAGFTAGQTPDGKTRLGKTGEITLQQMAIKMEGLANFTLTITLEIKDGKISDVAIGDVTFADATELGKLVAPDAKAVNPKATPGSTP